MVVILKCDFYWVKEGIVRGRGRLVNLFIYIWIFRVVFFYGVFLEYIRFFFCV